jgi:hypothetical protein
MAARVWRRCSELERAVPRSSRRGDVARYAEGGTVRNCGFAAQRGGHNSAGDSEIVLSQPFPTLSVDGTRRSR